MPPKYEQFKERIEKAQESSRRETFRQIQAAAVQAEKLTGDPKWDFFLRRVQAILNQLEPTKATIEQSLPGVFVDAEIRRQQLVHATLAGQIHALKQVMDMPREIMSEAGLDAFMASIPEDAIEVKGSA